MHWFGKRFLIYESLVVDHNLSLCWTYYRYCPTYSVRDVDFDHQKHRRKH